MASQTCSCRAWSAVSVKAMSCSRLIASDRDEERSRDRLVRHSALLAQCPERAKLVQRMQRRTLDVLGQRGFPGGRAMVGLHNAGHRLRLAQAFSLDETLQGLEAPPARRDLEQLRL